MPLKRRGRHPLDIVGIADICGETAGASAFRANRGRRRLGLREVTADDEDLRALGGENARNAAADAPDCLR
jgi:hypothetical protein